MKRFAFTPRPTATQPRRERASLLERWRQREEVIGELPVRSGGTEYRFQHFGISSEPQGVDQALLAVVLTILSWSVIMVYSASIALADNPRFGEISNEFFLVRHAMSIGVAFVVAMTVFQIPMNVWRKCAPWFLGVTVLLLFVVLIPGLGISVNGARRWLPMGIMRFQPSELAKLAVVIYTADYMVRRMNIREQFIRAVLPIGVTVGIIGMLLLAEPDMGAFVVVGVIAVGILFLGGVSIRGFLLMMLLLGLAFIGIIGSSEWRRDRIFAYLNPWADEHVLGRGYQLTHSLIAIGRGEVTGVGLGGSVEKLHWLPEAHTDFLLAVIGEEFGLLGVGLLIFLFFWLTRRIMTIGRQAVLLDRVFSGLVAQGIGIWIGFQTFINMGVNLGALPTKGLTLPLMSFGGSAMLLNLIAIAVVLRVDYENRILKRGGRV